MKKPYSAGKYRILCLILLLGTCGLAFVPTLFLYDYSIVFPEYTAFGVIKGFFTSLTGGSVYPFLFPSWSVYALLAGIFACLVGLVVSLCTKKARGVFLVTAGLSAFFFSAFAAILRYYTGYDFFRSLYAAPTLLAAYSVIILLIGANFDGNCGKARTAAFVFSALSAIGVSHAVLSLGGLSFSGMGLHVFTPGLPQFFYQMGTGEALAYVFAFGFTALLVVVALHYFVTLFLIGAKKGRTVSLIFFLLQTVLVVALYVLCIIIFKKSFDALRVYGSFAVIACGIAGIICSAIGIKPAKKEQPTATDADQTQLAIDGVFADAPQKQPDAAVCPDCGNPVTEGALFCTCCGARLVEEEPTPAADGQISMEEAAEQAQPAAEQAPAEQPAPTPVEEIVVPPVYQEAPQPTYAAPQQPVYPEQPACGAPQQPAYAAQPAYSAPQQPAYAPYYGVPVPTANGGPDLFYASLTPQEKQQFDDLFINCVLGENNRLPRYVVGGNNTEFFRKVFIFIGRYRAYISAGLLEKLYSYASRA